MDASAPWTDRDDPGRISANLRGASHRPAAATHTSTRRRLLRGFALERARRHGIWRAKTVVVAVRAFLRFLGATGQCPPGMQHAIPGFASWQLSTVPRFLAAEDVERVIASCPRTATGCGTRPCFCFWPGSGCAPAKSHSSGLPTLTGAKGCSP